MTGGAADITPKLFIFPHAGGTPQFYVPFAKSFTTDIKRTAVQYPRQGGKQDFGSFTSLPAVDAKPAASTTRAARTGWYPLLPVAR